MRRRMLESGGRFIYGDLEMGDESAQEMGRLK